MDGGDGVAVSTVTSAAAGESALPPLAATPPEGTPVLVACSGGTDSMVLAHRLATLGRHPLRAVHVHHGLQAQADAWADHCERFATALGVPFSVLRVAVDAAHPDGLEAAARDARYAALRHQLRDGEYLAIAHHRDDQAETVLMRLFRGSGLRGLAAMPALRPLAPGWLWRPLLDVPRARLAAYAGRHGLRGVDDPHNVDPRYSRAWLRGAVLPLLRARHPRINESLARAARHAAEAEALLCDLATLDRADPRHLRGPASSLSVASLAALSPARRRNLLRSWLSDAGYLSPEADVYDRLDTEVLAADADAAPVLRWRGCEVRRYRDRLFAMAPLPDAPPAAWNCTWPPSSTSVDLPAGCGRLVAASAPPAPLTIRLPRLGEHLRPDRAGPTRSLKNLCQERAVPPWVRLRMPVIERGGQPALLPALGLHTPAARPLLDASWQPRWEDAPVGAGTS